MTLAMIAFGQTGGRVGVWEDCAWTSCMAPFREELTQGVYQLPLDADAGLDTSSD
jgi:hypothetical protein